MLWHLTLFHRFATNYAESGRGFKLEYEAANESQWSYSFGDCGSSFTTRNGLLTYPSYLDNSTKYADCTYVISKPNGTYLRVNFMNITCRHGNGYVEFKDGHSEDSPVMGRKICGSDDNVTVSLQTTQGHLRIR